MHVMMTRWYPSISYNVLFTRFKISTDLRLILYTPSFGHFPVRWRARLSSSHPSGVLVDDCFPDEWLSV